MLNILLILSVIFSSETAESTLIRNITFRGNKTFNSKTLKKLLVIKEKDLFYNDLAKDLDNIKSFYAEHGFNAVQVTADIQSLPKGKIINFIIDEGPRTKIAAIRISGNRAFSEKELQAQVKLKENEFLIKRKINDQEKSLLAWYKNNGYPYVTIEKKITLVNNYATIEFFITEGALAYIKELTIRGNQKVTSQVILRTAQLRVGEKFSLEKLEKARQRLYLTKLFERVAFYILETQFQDSLTIRFDVLELPTRAIGIGLGIQTPPTRLLISSEWENYNFLSRGHNLFFATSYTPTFSQDFEIALKSSYQIFYIFNTLLNFTFQPSFKYKVVDTTKSQSDGAASRKEQSEFNVQTGVARFFGLKSEIGTYLQYQRIGISPQDTRPLKNITNSQNFYIRYDTRDNLFTPERGIFLVTNLQIAGSIFAGDNDFYKTQTELILFYKLMPKIILASRLMTGIAIPYGQTSQVPYFEAFSIGGSSGLRGYDEKAIGPNIVANEHYGEAINNINIELRTHFEKLLDLVIFADFGKVTERKDFINLSLKTFQYGAGAGLRINTPLGPIRFDYAKRLKQAPVNDWGKIYFGLLNTF